MGTHCYIAIEDPDGSVRYIFCHYDGYLRHMVPILKKKYTTRERVDALIRAGGIVSLQFNDESMEQHYSPMEFVSNRWEFEMEWRQYDLTIPYLYMFTRDDVWVCCCNGHMSLDDIM
jgi:hypothetical protein